MGEGRASRRGRQALRVDVILHRDRDAEKRKRRRVFRGQRFGLRQRIFLVAQADEHGRIVIGADALIAARNSLRRRHGRGAVRGDDGGNSFRRVRPHGEQNSGSEGYRE